MASKISNTEWGLVLGAAALLDAFQFALDLVVVGEIANPEIDLVVGPILVFYFRYRGVKSSGSKITAWILAPLLEIVTDGFLPIGWISEVAITMYLDKRDKKKELESGGAS